MKTVSLFLALAVGITVAPGCGKQQPEQQAAPLAAGAAPATAQGAPAAPAAPAAADAVADPGRRLETLLRERATRYAPSPLWKNRLGRFLVARGQADEGALLLDAAAGADPGDADLVLDAVLSRAARAGQLRADEAASLLQLLGAPVDPAAPGQVAMAAPMPGAMALAPPTPPGSPAGGGAPGAMPAAAAPGAVHAYEQPAPAPPTMPDMPAPGMPRAAAPGAMAPEGQGAPPPGATGLPDPAQLPNGGGVVPPAPPLPAAAGSAQAPPTSFSDALEQARAAVQKGDLARAGAMWQEALKFDPKSAAAWVGLADVTLMRGDASGAIGHYKEALRLSPHDTVVAKRLGDACFQSRQNECAFSAYEVATAAAPVSEDGYVWVRWAHVANQLGKRTIAEKALASAEKLLPADDRDLNTVRGLLTAPEAGGAQR